jgi:hypothetical protein
VREAISSAFEELKAEAPPARGRNRADRRRGETDRRIARWLLPRLRGGAMSESACAPRIEELSKKLRGLKARREELDTEEPEDREPQSDEDIARSSPRAGGNRRRRPADPQGLLQSQAEEIRVVSTRRSTCLCPRFDHRKNWWFLQPLSAPGRSRTCDTRLRRSVLYPLSYRGGRPIIPRCSSTGFEASLWH